VTGGVREPASGTRFSATLREATRREHDRAESGPFAVALAAGRVSRSVLAALAAQHFVIYSALEQVAGWMSADPLAGPFVDPRLDRVPALRADLETLHGPGWPEELPVTAATLRYRDRVLAVCPGRSERFVAHHYVRYLGDLSGGQAVRQALRRSGVATDEWGAAFYAFGAVGDRVAYKRRYREMLDALPEDRGYRRALVEEARRAFALTTDVHAGLYPTSGPGTAAG
jgi:heme oxygenase